MDEMFSYLVSYSDGLQTLVISDILIDCPNQEDNAGYSFWDQIVPNHKSSLKTLSIRPWYEGEWCYGSNSATAIGQCVSLQNLAIAVRNVDLVGAEAELSLTSANEANKYHDSREPYVPPENFAVRISFFFLFSMSCYSSTRC